MAEITVIPAAERSEEVIRTAAYARVSSDSKDQLNSFAAQIRYYSELLKDSTNAVLVDIYADEGITGTSAENGSIKAAQQRIDELSSNIDELIRLAASSGDTEQSMADIQKFSQEMTALREFIESEKAKQSASEKDTEQLEMVLDRLGKEDFHLTEYDDVAVRHLIECVKVMDKHTIIICFKGGFEVTQTME